MCVQVTAKIPEVGNKLAAGIPLVVRPKTLQIRFYGHLHIP